MRRILAGLDTEYGFAVEGHSTSQQISDAQEFVRAYPHTCFIGWDDSGESPRKDIRGFVATELTRDPRDAEFDVGTERTEHGVRADRILANGARLYNDHGHPEYATPECFSVEELILHDKAGDLSILECASEYEKLTGNAVSVFKNNTDFHGASYGSHESYLVPRDLGYEKLADGLLPLFVVRQILTGAGKVGSESGAECDFQISQRSDFFDEIATVDTLYRRPLFNTRDEPHADKNCWMRLHVICGESNMSPTATRLKVGLVKIALTLIQNGCCPTWEIADPVHAIKSVSRAVNEDCTVSLTNRSTTTAHRILKSYLEEYLGKFDDDEELAAIASTALKLLDDRTSNPSEFARFVDWEAKKKLLDQYREAENVAWDDPVMRALDLEYHRIDHGGGLFQALVEENAVEYGLDDGQIAHRSTEPIEPTRAMVRSLAIRKFGEKIVTANWSGIVFETASGKQRVELKPEIAYPTSISESNSVEEFIMAISEANRS